VTEDHRKALELRDALRSFLELDSTDRTGGSEAAARLNQAAVNFLLSCKVRRPKRSHFSRRRCELPWAGVGRIASLVTDQQTASPQDVRIRRVQVGVLRSLQTAKSTLVLVDSMRKPGKDARLSAAAAQEG
jgi:hypothetical protein